MWTLSQLQQIVNEILASQGKSNAAVNILSTDMPVARALGINLEPIGLPYIAGTIYVHTKSLAFFPDAEVRFILAHESAHIMKNHFVSTIAWNLIEMLAKRLVKSENQVETTKATLALMSPDHLSPDARALRNSEYEADGIAVTITHKLKPAISCLSRLSGGNLNNPSHTWEIFNIQIPAMTLGQRIEALRKSYYRVHSNR